MTAQSQNNELIQVDRIVIAENGAKVLERERKLETTLKEQIETIALLQEARATIDRQGKELVSLSNSLVKRDQEIDRLNKAALENSLAFQDQKNHTLKLVAENKILVEYLRTWLQVFESKFDSDENPELTEAADYIVHAVWMEANCGRSCYGFIRRVKEWYDNQPAWKQIDKVKI